MTRLLRPAGLGLLGVLLARCAAAATPFLSEIHYDDVGADSGEAIEILGEAGLDLTGWRLVLYNGATGVPYATWVLAARIRDEREGYGTLAVTLPADGLQNGPDGIALVDPQQRVVEWLSYEGSFVALSGPAAGLASRDIGVREGPDTPEGTSLQRGGAGVDDDLAVWLAEQPESFGVVNASQGLGAPWAFFPIATLQGADHRSAFDGVGVRTSGVVTALAADGFYLQDPIGDGLPETSEALFVQTDRDPGLLPGDVPMLSGVVVELAAGGSAELSTTALALSRVDEIVAVSSALPDAVLVGAGGRTPPAEVIDDDALTRFEPARDGIDFWESLEGMRARLRDAVSVSPTNFFDETFALGDRGEQASGLGVRGALLGSREDANPERIRVHEDPDWTGGGGSRAQLGDGLGDVEGVVDYAFGSFELRASRPLQVAPHELARETSGLSAAPGTLTVASYNLRNFGPADAQRALRLARDVVDALHAPAILALQEMQDDDGPADSGETEASRNAQMLSEAIEGAAGPHYVWIDRPPADGADGGQPGANIRVGFLYDPLRVSLVEGSVQRLSDSDPTDGDAFRGSRKPLAVEIRALGHVFVLVAVHFTSRSGGTPAFGAVQPPIVGGASRRLAQAGEVADWIVRRRAALPGALFVVLGDMNEVTDAPPLTRLAAAPASLRDLASGLPAGEGYSYVFEGQAELLDHVFVSSALFPHAELDVVHVNTGFLDAASDHDPVLARLDLAALPEPDVAHLAPAALSTLLVLRRKLRGRSRKRAARRRAQTDSVSRKRMRSAAGRSRAVWTRPWETRSTHHCRKPCAVCAATSGKAAASVATMSHTRGDTSEKLQRVKL